MKHFLMILTLLGSTAAFAAPATQFRCGAPGYGYPLSLQVGGPRYGDQISIDLHEEGEVKQVILAHEKPEELFGVHLSGFLTMGSCVRGKGDVLVQCIVKKDDWGFLNLGFSKQEEIAKDVHQGVTIDRRMNVTELDLKVMKVGTKARLVLKGTLDDGIVRARPLVLDREVGSLTHDWFMCKFE
jgi:hypothetical protein